MTIKKINRKKLITRLAAHLMALCMAGGAVAVNGPVMADVMPPEVHAEAEAAAPEAYAQTAVAAADDRSEAEAEAASAGAEASEDAVQAAAAAEDTASSEVSADSEDSLTSPVSARGDMQYANHGIPVVSIWLNGTTLDIINAGDKTVKYPGNSLDILSDGETVLAQDNVEIKGRGNTTWGAPKKPYQIKFEKKQDLFGIGKAKKWVLLADYLDSSHLRTDLAFSLGRDIGLEFTPQGTYVDLYVDGRYIGLYYLTSKIEINEAAVDLQDPYAVVVENDTIHEDGTDPTFRSKLENSLIWLKDCGKEENEAAAFKQFEDAYNKFERDVYNGSWDAIRSDIDVVSFAKYYLLNEYAANQDANHASFYMYKDGPDDVIHAGPIWDYDLAFSGLAHFYDDPYQLWVYNDRYNLPTLTSKLLTKLMDMPQFRSIVEALYRGSVADRITELIDSVDSRADALRTAVNSDAALWTPEDDNTNAVSLKSWMIRRKAFCDYIFTQRLKELPAWSINLVNAEGYLGYIDNIPSLSPAMSYVEKPFLLEPVGNGYYKIVNEATGLCLTDNNRESVAETPDGWEVGQVAVNGIPCSLDEWTGREGQQWMFFENGDGTCRILNKNSSYFLSSIDNVAVTMRWTDDTNQIFSITDAETLTQRRREFITHLYETCLGREPEEEGLNAWMEAILRGATGAQLVRGFVYSDEFVNQNLNDVDYIKALYAAIFDRDADSKGLAAWLDVLDHGCTRGKVVEGFASSRELDNLCRSIRIERGTLRLTDIRDIAAGATYFVDRLYKKCFSRRGDETGMINWVTMLYNGQITGREVVMGFFDSNEFKNRRLSNAEFIEAVYSAILDREPDASGLNTWTRSINNGRPRLEIVMEFASSREFANLCAGYGIRA